ncbi:MAG: hypothetical protein MUC49_05785 [Raineya sp.]|jgi:hypothetical protein|nr:hypothetical protein [Raineya sp.]
MKKRFLSVFSILLSLNTVFAQKVDLDPKTFKVSYMTQPAYPLSEDAKSFNIVLGLQSSVAQYTKKTAIKELIVVENLQRVNQNGGAVVEINLNSFYVTSSDVKTKVYKELVDGKTVERNAYYGLVSSEIDYTIVITDAKKMTKIFESGPIKSSFYDSSQESSDKKPGYDFLKNYPTSTIFTKAINQWATEVNKKLTSEIGYQKREEEQRFYYLDSKKHPEYPAFSENFTKLEAILSTIKVTNTDITEARKQAIPVLAYFDDLAKRYNKDEKGDKRLRYAGYYNAGLLNYNLDFMEEAIKYGELVVKNDYDKEDGKQLIKAAQFYKNLLEKNNTTSRHFPITWYRPNEIPDPAEDAVVVEAKTNPTTANNTPAVNFDTEKALFKIVKEGETLSGELDVNRVLLFCMKNTIKNIKVGDKFINIKPENTKALVFPDDAPVPFQGMTFESIKFLKSTNNTGGLPLPQKYFAEKLVDGKICVYKFYDVELYEDLKGASIREIMKRYAGNEQQLDLAIRKAYQNPSYLVKKGDKDAKYLKNVDIAALFEDNPAYLETYKKNAGSQAPPKKNLLQKMFSTESSNKELNEIAKKIEYIIEYNEATK